MRTKGMEQLTADLSAKCLWIKRRQTILLVLLGIYNVLPCEILHDIILVLSFSFFITFVDRCDRSVVCTSVQSVNQSGF